MVAPLKVTVLEVSLHREGVNPIYGEGVTALRLEDEGGGAFIVLKQNDAKEGELRLDGEELQLIASTAANLIAEYEGLIRG